MARVAVAAVLAFLVAVTSNAWSCRRAFVRNGVIGGVAIAGASILRPITLPANAYGEFEPGAKARRKAASATKSNASTTQASGPRIVESSQVDLKSALGDYSTSSATKDKKTKR